MNTWNQLIENVRTYWDILILNIPKITIAVIICCTFILVAVILGKLFKRKMTGKASDSITVTFVVRVTKSILIVVGIILAFHAMGFEGVAGGMLAGAGVGAIIVGFAFKEIGENFLAGIILVFDRPFNIGDTVKINDNMGTVVSLKFRTTHLKSLDGKDVYVPNGSVIRNDVINFTRDGLLRHEFTIGIDYVDDVDRANGVIRKTINSNPKVIRPELTQVLIEGFNVNTIDLKVMFWVNTFDYLMEALVTKSDVMTAVKNELLKNNFGLPANIHELKNYSAQPLTVVLSEKPAGENSEGKK